MVSLENEYLKIKISRNGAELRSVYDKQLNQERLWSGNENHWGRVSPVLFPIIGKLKNDQYQLDDQSYDLNQHGFLRNQYFNLTSLLEDKAVFSFSSSSDVYQVFPFDHEVEIQYQLKDSAISVQWTVKNLDDKTLPFSIGGHPGFALDKSKDYQFTFPNKISTKQILLKDGFVNGTKTVHLDTIDIEPKLFINNAVIYENVDTVILESKDQSEKITMNLPGFPYVGLWSPYYEGGTMAPFVCIEPWYGIPDQYDTNQNINDKLGILHLKTNEIKTIEYEMVFNEK